MLADANVNGQRPDPARGRGRGIVVVQTPARRIPAVKCVPRRVVRRLIGGEIYLPVAHRRERAALLYDAVNRVGELGRADAVENNRTYCDLPDVALAASLGIDALCQKVGIRVGVVGVGGGRGRAAARAL